MKKTLCALAPYALALGINFYLLPLFMKNTGTAMLLMLFVMPFASFVTAVIYGMRRGFSPLLSLLARLLFIPAVFIYFNSSAWVYAVFHAAAVFAGTALGRVLCRKR